MKMERTCKKHVQLCNYSNHSRPWKNKDSAGFTFVVRARNCRLSESRLSEPMKSLIRGGLIHSFHQDVRAALVKPPGLEDA